MNITRSIMLTVSMISGGAAQSANTVTDYAWTATWDSNERDLSNVPGESSKAAFAVQTTWKRLDFFGFLGWFRSQQPNKLVGFAQIDAPIEAGKLSDIIELTVKSKTPDIVFRLSLETPNDPDRCTFQAEIPTSTSFEKRMFVPADFTCWRRGEKLPVDRIVSFENVNKMTFLVTRSSQRAPTSTSESLAPFDLQISELNLR
ncbi:MAG: hypothetical protein WCO71_00590 [Pseudomonadota bacterium]